MTTNEKARIKSSAISVDGDFEDEMLAEEEPIESIGWAYALPFFAAEVGFAPATSQGRFGLAASGVSRSFTRS
jgi:hypothetical protein